MRAGVCQFYPLTRQLFAAEQHRSQSHMKNRGVRVSWNGFKHFYFTDWCVKHYSWPLAGSLMPPSIRFVLTPPLCFTAERLSIKTMCFHFLVSHESHGVWKRKSPQKNPQILYMRGKNYPVQVYYSFIQSFTHPTFTSQGLWINTNVL